MLTGAAAASAVVAATCRLLKNQNFASFYFQPTKTGAGAPPPPPAQQQQQQQQRQQQRGISSRMPPRSQPLGHVHEVVQSADAEWGVAPLDLYAWQSIEGYVRHHMR